MYIQGDSCVYVGVNCVYTEVNCVCGGGVCIYTVRQGGAAGDFCKIWQEGGNGEILCKMPRCKICIFL